MTDLIRHRQQVQADSLDRYHHEGIGRELHPVHDLYGSGWGDPYSKPCLQPVRLALYQALDSLPLDRSSTVLEIGCGGGRWTQVIAERLGELDVPAWLLAVDATRTAETRTRDWLAARGLPPLNGFALCPDGRLDHLPTAETDVVFSFDVFVHFDIDIITQYIRSISRVLRPGGRLLVNLACEYQADPSWTRSDEWFNYVLRHDAQDGSYQIDDQIRHYLLHWYAPPECTIPLAPGYGSALLTLTRNQRPA